MSAKLQDSNCGTSYNIPTISVRTSQLEYFFSHLTVQGAASQLRHTAHGFPKKSVQEPLFLTFGGPLNAEPHIILIFLPLYTRTLTVPHLLPETVVMTVPEGVAVARTIIDHEELTLSFKFNWSCEAPSCTLFSHALVHLEEVYLGLGPICSSSPYPVFSLVSGIPTVQGICQSRN